MGNEIRDAYIQQRYNAKRRNIKWQFTYLSWMKWWLQTGKWSERGKGKGKYCMARFNDTGPYLESNVKCITHEKNSQEIISKGWKHSTEAKAKIGAIHKGNKYWLGKKHSPKTKIKMQEAKKLRAN